jgi:hypothetical protein
MGRKASKAHFTQAEKAWLQAHPVIRVGIDRDFAPYEWIDSDGNYRPERGIYRP